MKLFKKYRIKELKDGFIVERRIMLFLWVAYDEKGNDWWLESWTVQRYATRYKSLSEARQAIERAKKKPRIIY